MSHFETILSSRGLEAAAAYAAAAQFKPGVRRAAVLRREAAARPMRPGKTARDRAGGATARRAASRAKRDAECQAAKGKAGQK